MTHFGGSSQKLIGGWKPPLLKKSTWWATSLAGGTRKPVIGGWKPPLLSFAITQKYTLPSCQFLGENWCEGTYFSLMDIENVHDELTASPQRVHDMTGDLTPVQGREVISRITIFNFCEPWVRAHFGRWIGDFAW